MLRDMVRRPRHVAIGTFDGVHLGHRAVISGANTVLTFDPHPRQFLSPDRAPEPIMSLQSRSERIAQLGVTELVIVPFDREMADLSAEDFVQLVLMDALDARTVSIGENFRFGAGARGTPDLLARQLELEVRVVPMVEVDGAPVSSTRIRDLLEEGDVAEAQRCLGAPFTLEGVGVSREPCGRDGTIATTAIVPDPVLAVPAPGVYATVANGAPAVSEIGARRAKGSEPAPLVETRPLDPSPALAGESLRIAFVERLGYRSLSEARARCAG